MEANEQSICLPDNPPKTRRNERETVRMLASDSMIIRQHPGNDLSFQLSWTLDLVYVTRD